MRRQQYDDTYCRWHDAGLFDERAPLGEEEKFYYYLYLNKHNHY